MKNKNKLRIGLSIGIVVFGLGMVTWMNTASSSVKANSANSTQASSAKILDPVKNTEGLSATAKRVVLSQDDAFPDVATEEGRKLIFSKQGFLEAKKEVFYEYSDAKGNAKKPSSETAGFQLVYVKVSDKVSKSTILVPVPVTITNSGTTLLSEERVAIQLDNGQNQIQLQLNEVKDKNAEELQQIVKEKGQVHAWRTDNGEELPVAVSETTIDPSVAGSYKATFKVTLDAETVQMEKEVNVEEGARALNPAPRADDGVTWELQKSSAKVGLITPYGWLNLSNGFTGSVNSIKSYPSLSVNVSNTITSVAGYEVRIGTPSLFGGRYVGATTLIPSESGKLLPSLDEQRAQLTINGYKSSDGKRIKQEVVNKTLGLKYIMEATMNSVNSYRVQTRLENTSPDTRNLGFFNKGVLSTSTGSTTVKKTQLFSIGNGRGVKGKVIQPSIVGSDKEVGFGIDFKPRVDDPYTYWDVKDVVDDPTWIGLNTTALRPGMEKNRIKAGALMFDSTLYDFPFSAGVPERPLASGESISATWDLTFGEIPSYLTLDAIPEEYNVYQDTLVQEFKYDYTIGNIPNLTDSGTIVATFPDKSKEEKSFSGTKTTGSFTVPRTKLPDRLNDVPGTINYYETGLLAMNHATGGLPSEDKILSINVYNLGGTPSAQIVKKNSIWSKKADALINDPVILPGHKAAFKYVNEAKPVDTSKVGMQFADVLMTDTNEPIRTAIIKVPVMVTDGSIPTTGLFLGANDFTIEQKELKGLTDAQLKEMILKNSNAAAWDVTTGLSEGIDLSVSATTLKNTSDNSKKYTATISAKSYDEVKETTINITVTAKSKLTINFIDETDTLKTIEVTKELGRPTDLSKDPDVIQVLKELETDKRELEERPANETAYPIAEVNEPVTYRFRSNANLIISFPNVDETELLAPDIKLTKRIGTQLDLREEPEVAAVLKYLEEEKHYELYSHTDNDEDYVVTSKKEQTIIYIFNTQSRINVQFINEEDKLVENLFLYRKIGSLDLTKDDDILAAIQKLEGQHYEVIKRPENETAYPIRPTTENAIYQVKKMEVPVNIHFVDEDGVDIPKVEPINSTGIIGTTLNLQQFDTEIQKRLEILKGEHYELVETPADNQEITGPGALDVFYRFKGSLFIGSFPGTLNFGDKYLKSKVIKGEQPKYDKDLVIKDTRKVKSSWQLTATLEKPLTSEENPSEIINNVLYYKKDAADKISVPLLKGEAQPVETGKATASGEYNISEKWTNNKTGVELSVNSNRVNQTGKYTASILWEVSVTP